MPYRLRPARRDICRSFLLAFAAAVPVTAAGDHAPLNTPPEGFVALFNGRDLTGWQGLVGDPRSREAMSAEQLATAQVQADRRMRQHWSVVEGALVFDGQGENLCTVGQYGNFELYVDWKIEPQGDSGIYLRGSPQVQIWDPWQSDVFRIGSGGLFNNQRHPDEPLVRADRPIGEWNTFYVMMMGQRVSVKLNDKLVVDDTVMENYWDRSRPIVSRGPIELQSHGNPLAFRSIYLRELPSEPAPAWFTLFDGEELEHWDFRRRGWRVDDGLLTVSRRRENREGDNFIWTKERFGDFILELEFKLSPECDSGILIRTDDRENWMQTGIEIQIADSHGRDEVGKRDCGAVLDIMSPRINAARPADEWNRMTIVTQENLISVTLNDQRVIELNLDQWTEPGRNPDSSENPLQTACRDLKRDGYVGFQDGGQPIWFRNVRIKRLDKILPPRSEPSPPR